ncbi:MAG TPA: type II CAAX endopeptidase family protein [Clostridiales bacterium]|nr:type II CAAX endopeptidase family protein [Clostridiales bacterium]
MKIFKNKYGEVRPVWKLLLIIPAFYLFTGMLIICFAFFYELSMMLSSGITDPAVITEKFLASDFTRITAGIIQNLVMIALVILFWKQMDKKPLSQMGLTFGKSGLTDLVYGLILGAVSITIVFVIMLLTGQIVVEKSVLKPNFVLVFLGDLLMMIFVGVGEEMFSRGYCMSILRRSHTFIILIVPNVIFSLLHIFNSNIGVLPLFNIFLIGVMFSLMFLRRGNIWMPIGYHITWNFLQGSIFGMPVSGGITGGLLTTRLVGENILNGGGFGPEGSLIVTGLILVSIAVLLTFTKSKDTGEEMAAYAGAGGTVEAGSEAQAEM